MISRRKLAATIAEQLIESSDQSSVMKQLAAYVIENNLEAEVDRIITDVNRYLAAKGHVLARVTTARSLDAATKNLISHHIKQLSDNKTEVIIDEQVDPSIIGGVIIQTPDKQLDLSVASQLKQLRNA